MNCTKGVLALNVVFCSILNCEQFLFFFRFSERVHVLARNEDGGQGKKETSRSLIPSLPENITFPLSLAWGGVGGGWGGLYTDYLLSFLKGKRVPLSIGLIML